MAFWSWPNTGAAAGNKEYNDMRTVGKYSSGAGVRSEKKHAKKQAKKAERIAKRRAEGKSSFWD